MLLLRFSNEAVFGAIEVPHTVLLIFFAIYWALALLTRCSLHGHLLGSGTFHSTSYLGTYLELCVIIIMIVLKMCSVHFLTNIQSCSHNTWHVANSDDHKYQAGLLLRQDDTTVEEGGSH